MNDLRWKVVLPAIAIFVAAVAGLTVVLVYVFGGESGDTPSSPSATASPDDPVASRTPVTPFPTQEPSPTPAGPPSSTDILAEATPLTLGMAATVGYEMVIYYNVGCYACSPGITDPWRAYLDPGGELVRQRLADNLPADYQGKTLYSFAGDWDAGLLYLAVCMSGSCFYDPDPAAVNVLLRSNDGGITWSAVGELPNGTAIAGFREGEVIVGAPPTAERTAYAYQTWPDGDPVEAPRDDQDYFAMMIDGVGLAWRGADGTILTSAGNTLAGPLFSDEVAGFLRTLLPGGAGLLLSWQSGEGEERVQALTALGPDGSIRQTWRWPSNALHVVGAYSATRIYGNILLDGPFCARLGCVPSGRQFGYEAAMVDLETATIHPYDQLAGGLDGNSNPFIEHVRLGRFAVVEAGVADCLNVRAEAATSAAPLGCFIDGVLLGTDGTTVDADDRAWLRVTTPDGRAGYAAAEFLHW